MTDDNNEENFLEDESFNQPEPKRRKAGRIEDSPQHIEFLKDLHDKGLYLNEEQSALLRKHGINVDDSIAKNQEIREQKKSAVDKIGTHALKRMDTWRRRKDGPLYQHCNREIETKEWKPKSVTEFDDEFWNWVVRMNEDGFQKKPDYRPLSLYVSQAHNWLSEDERAEDYDDKEELYDFAFREWKRCQENCLYYLNKYLKLKEADLEDASAMDYSAKPVHEVICFLMDCGYNQVVGKSRQIAATTTYLGIAIQRMATFSNFFVKFITMDEDTGKEIIDDKMKYAVSELPDWWRPSVRSDSEKMLYFGRKIPGQKGKRGGADSKFRVVAPTVSAINGGAPTLVYVDEAGYIKILGKMVREGRPTMFKENPATGKLELTRQLVIWSTGGTDEGNNRTKTKAYEEFFMDVWDKWKKKDFSTFIVPLFFDWTTRPGITQEFYESEKQAYTVEGPHAQEVMNQFRLTYPSKIEDMFLDSSKLLMDIAWIQSQEDRINMQERKPVPGYFKPIYDISKPNPEHVDHPYFVMGAEFIPCELGDPKISTWIFIKPEKGWIDRYYMGVDPVSSDNGYSNMSGAVWDDHYQTICAITNYREPDHKETFSQTFLLGLYYRLEKEEIPQLIESNAGVAYIDYVDNQGYHRSLVYKTELPMIYQGGGQKVGLDNKGRRNRAIINHMHELFSFYGDRIYFMTAFYQLRSFVCTVTDHGTETWGTKDVKKYFDDVLFSMTFAYICRMCFEWKTPKYYATEDKRRIVTYELKEDSTGNLTRMPVYKKRH